MKKTVKNLYERDIHSVLLALLKTLFSHKHFSWILNEENKE